MARSDAWLSLFAGQAPRRPGPLDRWDGLALALAVLVGGWFFAFKMRAFWALGTTSDLYHSVQIASSWLRGLPFGDNEFGDILATHTAFIAIPLGLFSRPFGAPGLLFALSLSASFSLWSMNRTLRALAVPPPLAALAAAALVLMPISAVFFYDPTWAFTWELLAPAFAVGLLGALLQRKWTALVWAFLLLATKEEMPLLVAVVAVMVVVEEELGRRHVAWAGRPGLEGKRANLPALVSIAASAAALPVLLHVIRAHPTTAASMGNFDRLPVAWASGAKDTGSLAGFVLGHLPEWLGSSYARDWPKYMLYASLGLLVLRPHFLAFGIVLTVVSWLKQDQLLWPHRFATSLAFAWCTAVLALGSVAGALEGVRAARPGTARGASVAVALGLAAVALALSVVQARLVPQSVEVYRMQPWGFYSPEERADADAVFAAYREQGKDDEPATASLFLFRYVHDRPLYWLWRLDGMPRPVWVLYDEREGNLEQKYHVVLAGYDRVGSRGRFSLYRRKTG